MKNSPKILSKVVLCIATCFFLSSSFAQVGINTTAPAAASVLDVESNDKGILIPRVDIDDLSTSTPITGSPPESLLVFNTNNTTGKGFYYWDSSAWIPIAGIDTGWSTLGNDISDGDYLGTNNNEELSIRVNSIEKVRITPHGTIETYNTGNSVFIGESAGENSITNNTSLASVFIGKNSGMINTVGIRNTAIGNSSLESNTSGIENVAIGVRALKDNESGDGNVAIGLNAGQAIETGVDNIFIGRDANASVSWAGNSIAIGANSIVTGFGQVRLGDASILSIGGYANWTNLSDGRFKTNINENVAGLDFITKLRPVTYTMNIEALNSFLGRKTDLPGTSNFQRSASMIRTGFIAQEVETLAKEIGYSFSGIDVPDDPDRSHYGLRYSEFVVPLVKAVQEQQTQIEVLEQKIKELNQLLNSLRSATARR